MANDKPKEKFVSIRDYKVKELAAIYEESPYLMKKRIKAHEKVIGKKNGQYYLFDQVKLIFELIKPPSHVTIVV